MELLWPEGASSEEPSKSLTRSFTRAVYLQQDQVRSFIEDEDEKGRFDIVGEIVGAGRVGELVRKLEGSRKAWTTATNQISQRELQPLVQRQVSLKSAINDAQQDAPRDLDLDARWTAWLTNSSALLGQSPSDGQRRQQLDGTLSQLQALSRTAELRLNNLRGLRDLIANLPAPDQGVEAAEQQAIAADALLAQRESELAAATERAAMLRQQLVEQTGARDSLAAMARLALGHLTDSCPVCQQPHDRQATEQHLQALIAAATTSLVHPSDGVEEAASALREAEDLRSTAQAELRGLQRAQQDRVAKVNQITSAAEALDLASQSNVAMAAEEAIEQAQAQVGSTSALRREGEQLSAGMARLEQGRRAEELAEQLPALEADIAGKQAHIALREAAGEDAKRLHESLRSLSESLVASELEVIEPLLQRIYASVDPHPTFRAVKFLTDTHRGRGRLWTSVEDETNDKSVTDPNTVLSSSQLNVLAVVTFMAMNLSAHALPLEVAALDDPLQSLDNVNLLGLADLLRRTRQERQVIISTHDERLVGLLERKLRPVGPNQRTTTIHMDGWQPAGPVVTARDLAVDTGERRLLRSVS